MTKESLAEVPLELADLVEEALQLGYECFGAGDRTPFILLELPRGKRHLIDVHPADGRIDAELLESGRKLVATTFRKSKRYAVVWDGYLRSGRKRQDAVFVEAGQRGEPEALIYAQVYQPRMRTKKLKKIGHPVVASTTKSLLATQPRPARDAAARSSSNRPT